MFSLCIFGLAVRAHVYDHYVLYDGRIDGYTAWNHFYIHRHIGDAGVLCANHLCSILSEPNLDANENFSS